MSFKSAKLTVSASALTLARKVLEIESAAVGALGERLDSSFLSALQCILDSKGRVIVSGMGKSGHIARKIAATLSSTGTPAYFVHPSEAAHGDLGLIQADDVFIALSNSGSTTELLTIAPIIKRMGAKLIAMTGNPNSSLAKLADAHLDAGVSEEACPLNLAPTASTTAALALGDALAVALLEARGFSVEDFARSHPGGSLGRRLLIHVHDIMRKAEQIPQVLSSANLTDALLEISSKGMGMTAVCNEQGGVEGIFTDGDLRRLVENGGQLKGVPIVQVMHPLPHTISPEALAAEAAEHMDRYRISQILVVDETGLLVGALSTHDLMNAKVI